MKPDERDIICEQDYSPLSNAELVEAIERYAAIMHTAPLVDFDLEWITGPARVMLARVEAAEALAYERLEAALFAEQRATDAELRAEEAAAEAQTAEEELETERETTDETNGFIDSLIASLDHPIRGDEVFLSEIVETATALKARVAELEAQLAVQQWRPVTEKPPEPPDGEISEYLTWNDFTGFTVRRYRDGQFHSAFRKQPTHYCPLPPAPQETTQ